MKKLFVLALFAISLIACTERGDDFVNSQLDENKSNLQSREESESAAVSNSSVQDPAIIVPPRR